MNTKILVLAAISSLALATTARANVYGSVEPIANTAVLDTTILRDQSLDVRQAFAERLLSCGIVDGVITSLSRTGALTTIDRLNTHFQVGAGGFAGHTNPSFVYTVIDGGPNGASEADIKVLTDGLGYVLSQGSAFLLDADRPERFDFPANYVVLNFGTPPPLSASARLFRAVGRIDPELFETDSSGYTQYGRAYLSLQSFVPDVQFIEGYSQAAAQFGLEYTPIVGGVPSLFRGGAAFPGNDWTANPKGEEYLDRIPQPSHAALRRLRAFHLRVTREVLRQLDQGHRQPFAFSCQ
jgi:hypothetical protein